ncbi:MAG: hypothetical protein OEY64_09780 [Nitrospinota bacterium]|nr:hypothetical protein [Nitrospinota bacterium]
MKHTSFKILILTVALALTMDIIGTNGAEAVRRSSEVAKLIQKDYDKESLFERFQFNVKVREFAFGTLHLNMPRMPRSRLSGKRLHLQRDWFIMRIKAEEIAKKYPEVKNIVWHNIPPPPPTRNDDLKKPDSKKEESREDKKDEAGQPAKKSSKKMRNRNLTNINIIYGLKNLKNNYWEPKVIRSQRNTGFEFDYAKKSWPVSALAGISQSFSVGNIALIGSEVAVQNTMLEFDFGIKKYIQVTEIFLPYISLGGASMQITEKGVAGTTTVSNTKDIFYGYFVGGGILFNPNETFNIGIDFKSMYGSKERMADYEQAILFIGFGF